ncbi:MAG TPA: NAD(P)H-dependent oxidoreductase subunit E [Planctomycetaceae bacterium]
MIAMIVKELHHLQEKCGGYLPKDQLKELAERLGVPQYRLQEVASFFNHFRFDPPPKVRVQVCRDVACHMRGSERFRGELESAARDLGPDVTVEGVSCLGRCDGAVAVLINGRAHVGQSSAECARLMARYQAGERPATVLDRSVPASWRINPYPNGPEWATVRRIATAADPAAEGKAVLDTIKASGLVGKGGPGAGTANKWERVLQQKDPVRYVVCNADESEPGTFKDREILLRAPHLVIEGVLTAGLILGAERCWIYVRHEYPDQIAALREAIAAARAAGVCGQNVLGSGRNCEVDVFESPGNYICGEQTALLEAMEDKRAEPRVKPSNPELKGLYNRPTLVNNVETFAWVPAIAIRGADWYKGLGANGCTGMRFTSISGDVERPGVYEVPLGATVGELLELCGGMLDGQRLQAFMPSGPSGGFLPPVLPRRVLPESFVAENMKPDEQEFDLLRLRLDNNYFRRHFSGELSLGREITDAGVPIGLTAGFTLGAAHFFVGERTDLRSLVRSATRFYRNESCGKCVPCRVGTQKLTRMTDELVAGKEPAPDVLWDLQLAMREASICGLGEVASAPLATYSAFFAGGTGGGSADGRPAVHAGNGKGT